VILGALLELLLIIANIGTVVVLFPILKRHNEILLIVGFPSAIAWTRSSLGGVRRSCSG
jgi:hypothetical protein